MENLEFDGHKLLINYFWNGVVAFPDELLSFPER
jgi:hypothetical protein